MAAIDTFDGLLWVGYRPLVVGADWHSLHLKGDCHGGDYRCQRGTRDSAEAWIKAARLSPSDFLFPSRIHGSPHLSTRQYARLVHRWIGSIGLDDTAYGTHTMRRTKASLIYRRTKNLRAVQLLLGHTKLESTVRYLGIEVDDALEMAEQTEA
ncbi:tyrosine-type recombinase/integrase [Trinickia mobilis]|uniref:tyrosine-type recombinase/integrase n=1 Tax=Trinickia mobilis TaxID=2816356 RepID=UPI0035AC03CC